MFSVSVYNTAVPPIYIHSNDSRKIMKDSKYHYYTAVLDIDQPLVLYIYTTFRRRVVRPSSGGSKNPKSWAHQIKLLPSMDTFRDYIIPS